MKMGRSVRQTEKVAVQAKTGLSGVPSERRVPGTETDPAREGRVLHQALWRRHHGAAARARSRFFPHGMKRHADRPWLASVAERSPIPSERDEPCLRRLPLVCNSRDHGCDEQTGVTPGEWAGDWIDWTVSYVPVTTLGISRNRAASMPYCFIMKEAPLTEAGLSDPNGRFFRLSPHQHRLVCEVERRRKCSTQRPPQRPPPRRR